MKFVFAAVLPLPPPFAVLLVGGFAVDNGVLSLEGVFTRDLADLHLCFHLCLQLPGQICFALVSL